MTAATADATRPGGRFVDVFSGETNLLVLKALKPGFRHCCVMVEAGQFWVFYNPTSRGTDIAVFDGLTLEAIVAWFLDASHIVFCGQIRDPGARMTSQRIFTCVEAVKRVLGVRAPAILTPWQLYQWLVEEPVLADKRPKKRKNT